mmetsp:Transcript_11941/g.29905  ORF Transcript_11941/g.29905 Transcript_11941/m.29905 type:complete len:268 (+) Transcript_11941:58-861(+)
MMARPLLLLACFVALASGMEFPDMSGGPDYQDMGVGDYDESRLGGAGSPSSDGVVMLDHITYNKVVGGKLPVFVRFDKEYPYGAEDKAFLPLGDETGWSDVVIASLGASEYVSEHKARQIFADVGVKMEDTPVFMYFAAGSKEGVTFTGDKTDTKAYISFLKGQGVEIVLEGCLKAFDLHAHAFMAKSATRKEVMAKAEADASALQGNDLKASKGYVQIMKKVLEKGDGYIQTEAERVKKMLTDRSVPEDKKPHFSNRANILSSFSA